MQVSATTPLKFASHNNERGSSQKQSRTWGIATALAALGITGSIYAAVNWNKNSPPSKAPAPKKQPVPSSPDPGIKIPILKPAENDSSNTAPSIPAFNSHPEPDVKDSSTTTS